ncbi:MAG: ABC transporter substrate-binding protein [Vicinamibacteria bacterium]|nr:ABC transporter substrate-binding protein [Vicinamibacteria bacterium]
MNANIRRALFQGCIVLISLHTATAVAGSPTSTPRRVASLFLAADEVLVAILPLDRLVAVTAMADDETMSNVVGRVPSSATRFHRADVERLIALRPDLVVVSEFNDADFLHLLGRSGLRTHRFEGVHSIAGIRRAIISLGRAVGETRAARELVARMDARLSRLETRLAGAPRPRVLYWSSPFTAGSDTAIGALIECGGGVNAAREAGVTGLAPIGAERALAIDPDATLVNAPDEESAPLSRHPSLSHLRAVRQGRVVAVPTRHLVALSHHAADACVFVAHALHPDRVSGVVDD